MSSRTIQDGNLQRRKRQPPQFDLIAGVPCLDFINTLDDRHKEKPRELITSYADMARFAEEAGLISAKRSDELRAAARRSPEQAEITLAMARDLREAMHEIFWAVIQKNAVPANALMRLNVHVHTAQAHLHLEQTASNQFEWRYDDMRSLESLLWPLAESAARLLASENMPLVRACASKDCEWFFLDTTKNHQRRWCDMKRCGNRAKVRSFYARQKKRR